MKLVIPLLLIIISCSTSYSQNKDESKKFLIGFFVNGFDKDSIHVILNKDTVMKVRLRADPLLDQCNTYVLVEQKDSDQILTIFEVERKKSFQTIIKSGFQYLYMFRLDSNNYQFKYSNRLSLPE